MSEKKKYRGKIMSPTGGKAKSGKKEISPVADRIAREKRRGSKSKVADGKVIKTKFGKRTKLIWRGKGAYEDAMTRAKDFINERSTKRSRVWANVQRDGTWFGTKMDYAGNTIAYMETLPNTKYADLHKLNSESIVTIEVVIIK